MTTQRGPRAFIDDPQPGNHVAIGEAFLVSGINLPGIVRMLGSLPRSPRPSAGRCWSKVVQPQPALDGPHRRQFVLEIHPHQLDSDATCSPTGMLTPQLDGGLQHRWRREWARSTGVITGQQRSRRLIGRSLSSSSY
jgi:hypothetical protein